MVAGVYSEAECGQLRNGLCGWDRQDGAEVDSNIDSHIRGSSERPTRARYDHRVSAHCARVDCES